MSDIAIRIENLGKQYHIGQSLQHYATLRDVIAGWVTAPIRRFKPNRVVVPRREKETIWALRDVSLEVKHGEAIGIIGRNGAGKSTLLKILSKITEPTTGYAEIYGRVCSLLEVGTGFHPELTGRENIYLNGAILGMHRREIDGKFDEIVAFAEFEKFLDTPVKHYSSGMYMRLAFSVAAHLEPEILIVDEVLAVGDVAFQKKCLGKMNDVAQQGRTVLFVSHNMAAIRRLCSQAALFAGGQLKMLGQVDEVARYYEQESVSEQSRSADLFPIVNHRYGLALNALTCEIETDGGQASANFIIRLQLESKLPMRGVGLGVQVFTRDGVLISALMPKITGNVIERIEGKYDCVLACPEITRYLAGGEYLLTIVVGIPQLPNVLRAENIAAFVVPQFDHYDSGHYFQQNIDGFIPLPLKILPAAQSR
jgi:lipopolysaccharide transport system ATP-binding protein